MKKVLFLLVVLPMLLITSCKKEEVIINTIENTIWEGSYVDFWGSNVFVSLELVKKIAKFSYIRRDNSITMYEYQYINPKVTFIPTQDNKFKVTLYGYISGDIMKVENPTITYGDQVIYTLYKMK